MTITHRSPAFFVSLSMVGALCILGPILVLWTAGYRWNTSTGALEKTGAMVIETTPTGVRVALDQQEPNTTTPARFPTVFPRPYHVTLTKTGFLPFAETLFVEPGRTSYITNARLFPATSSTLVATGTIPYLAQSSDGGLLAFPIVDGRRTSIVSMHAADGTRATLFVATSTVSQLTWAPQGETLLAITEQNGNKHALILSAHDAHALTFPATESLVSISWAEGDATRLVALTKDRTVARVRLIQAATGESIVLTTLPASATLAAPHLSGTLVTIAQTTATSTSYFDIVTRADTTPVLRATTSPYLVEIRARDGDTLHLDLPQQGKHGALSLKYPEDFVPMLGTAPVRAPLGSTTLAANDAELVLDGTPSDMVTRIAAPITGHAWIDADTVLMSTPSEISAFTTQTFQTQHHRTVLATMRAGTGMAIYRTVVYFSGIIDNTPGLYARKIE